MSDRPAGGRTADAAGEVGVAGRAAVGDTADRQEDLALERRDIFEGIRDVETAEASLEVVLERSQGFGASDQGKRGKTTDRLFG